MQYLCNGFIFDTQKSGEEYNEDERKSIFESAVKLLYRCLFLFYAESRSLLPSEKTMQKAYSLRSIHALCDQAHKFQWGNRQDYQGHDMWKHLKGLINAVNEGDPDYGIIGYNGGLFDDDQESFLGKHRLRNDFIARALYLMAYVEPLDSDQDKEYVIPYEDLEVRHLGELYENILEFNVTLADEDRIRRRTKKGVEILLLSTTDRKKGDTLIKKGEVYFAETALERKQSGSYYTPESLVDFINNKAIVKPLQKKFTRHRERFNSFVEQAKNSHDANIRQGALQSAVSLLDNFITGEVFVYKVCDPAMGSGHFLINAANQMTGFIIGLLAELPRSEDVETKITSNPNYWRRLITRHCIYGVDLNPLSTHLAKLSLWLNSFARDHKLTFLDHHLRCGNSLVGVRTFDDVINPPMKNKELKKKNPKEISLFPAPKLDETLRDASKIISKISSMDEDDTDFQKESFDDAYTAARDNIAALADLRTAFLMGDIMSGQDYASLNSQLIKYQGNPELLDPELQKIWQKVEKLRDNHHFFHWMLEFAGIFAPGGKGGFDATIGNPPWDIVKTNSQEFFNGYDTNFRKYSKPKAKKVADELMRGNPSIRHNWLSYCDVFENLGKYFREQQAYSAVGKGHINTFKLFLEQFFTLLNPGGYEGIVVPSGLYTDKGCQPLRELFFEKSRIDCLYCFENKKAIFNIHRSFKFVIFCTEKGHQTKEFKCAFMQHDPAKLQAIDAGALKMSINYVGKFSPESLSIVEFDNQKEIDIASKLYGQNPFLGEYFKDRWDTGFHREFNITDDSDLFIDGDKEIGINSLPLWEGKQIWILTNEFSEPTNWMNRNDALIKPSTTTTRLTYRALASNTNERTFIPTVIPAAYPTGNSLNVCSLPPRVAVVICGIAGSFIMDWILRNKVTTNVNMFIIEQLPIVDIELNNTYVKIITNAILYRGCRLLCTSSFFSKIWEACFIKDWISPDFWFLLSDPIVNYGPKHEQAIRKRLRDQATNLTSEWTPECGVHDRLPDRRDIGDRAQLRAEIDAYVAHLYKLSRDDFAYILDTFPVLKRKEETAFGEFMSKRKCLEEYDRIKIVLAQSTQE